MALNKFIVYATLMTSLVSMCNDAPAQQTKKEKEIYSQLSEDERRTLDFFGENDPALSEWKSYLIYLRVDENFFEAALWSKCMNIRRMTSDQASFNADFREALLSLTERTRRGEIGPTLTPDVFRYKNRVKLWAMQKTSRNDIAALWSLSKSESGQQALRHLRSLAVLQQFLDRSIDIRTGEVRADSVLWLKNYFKKSGEDAHFINTIRNTDHSLAKAYAELRPISEYSSTDIKHVATVAKGMHEISTNLIDTLFENLPSSELTALQKIANSNLFEEFSLGTRAVESMNMQSLATILNTSSDTDTTTSQDSKIILSILAAYPEPKGYLASLANMKPSDWVENKHLDFCDKNPIKP